MAFNNLGYYTLEPGREVEILYWFGGSGGHLGANDHGAQYCMAHPLWGPERPCSLLNKESQTWDTRPGRGSTHVIVSNVGPYVHAIYTWHVGLAVAQADLLEVTALTIDETSYRRAHNYLTWEVDATVRLADDASPHFARTPEPSGRYNSPQSSTPKVKAGTKITRGKHGTGPGGTGTAGVIVRKKGATSGAQVMTCAHVLGMQAIGPDATVKDANVVYSPELSTCSGVECNRPFGEVINATLETINADVVQASIKFGSETFAVDAALIDLAPDANGLNEIPKIGQIAGVRDLVQEWSLTTPPGSLELPPARQIQVKKYGAVTEYTEGTIKRLAKADIKEVDPGTGAITDSKGYVFEVEVNAGQSQFKQEYELDMDQFMSRMAIATADEVAHLFDGTKVTATVGGAAQTPTLKIVGTTFSQKGDSGSPIVDSDRKIVGILRSGSVQRIYVKGKDPVDIVTGNSQGVFIAAAFEKLEVALLSPGQQTSGARIVVPGMAIQRAHGEALDWHALDRIRDDIERSPAGIRLTPVFRRHFDEIRQLVHHRRRVTVTWHRFKGPAFVTAFLRAARSPSKPLVPEIDGVRLNDAMRAMRNALMAEGSPGLQNAIMAHEAELFELADKAESIDALVEALSPVEDRRA
ncbi:hypothetical protein BJ917_1525 [Pseudomonas sp. WPR_5_2]|uniref:hypothetical protein n=1 Tax=Pseudomonas sp. WPR_5_2 TaxID=1907371 RepID=UPI000EB27500|nr:hypothetical protein [Pseudomonas sp. WPR_5_2]RKS28629.1 hypothetical protein BJ917_1525 [Pseudomonas sp. WPR_5_2]